MYKVPAEILKNNKDILMKIILFHDKGWLDITKEFRLEIKKQIKLLEENYGI